MNSPSSTTTARDELAARAVPAALTYAPISRGLQIVRGALLLGLALIVTLLLGLGLLSSSSLLSDAVRPLFQWESKAGVLAGWLTVAFIALVPIALLLLAWRLRLRSWWWIGGGYLAVAPVLAYLAVDDPVVLHPTTIDEIAPAFPGAEKSYAVLMQYSKQTPSAEAKTFAQWKQRIVGMPVSPDKPAEWKAFLEKNRTAIEADWADMAPQRRWLAELNAFDRFGDLGAASPDANIITFQVWRLLSQRALHIAGLHVLDGSPDAAVDTLLPILQAGRKLQPSARTLVRFMVAVVIEKMTIMMATDLVQNTQLSAASRAKLAAAIAGGVRGEAGARRLVGIEQSLNLGFYDQPVGDLLAGISFEKGGRAIRTILNVMSPFVYNPRRTINQMGELNSELQDLAARRQSLMGGRADEVYAEKTRPRFKNLVGAFVIDVGTPAYSKIVTAYWELHDRREKLAALLAAK